VVKKWQKSGVIRVYFWVLRLINELDPIVKNGVFKGYK
jgi:hypothetical protein